MKKTLAFAFIVLVSAALAACGITSGGDETVTFYLVSPTEAAGVKKIGCDEYLVPDKTYVSGKATVAKALNALFSADPAPLAGGGGLMTAAAIKDKYFLIDEVFPDPPEGTSTVIVSLKRNPGVGLTGACDVPRAKEQIKETVRAAVGTNSFVIRLDGSTNNWDCLGDESGRCG